MCELLGFSSLDRRNIGDYLNEFYSHCDTNPNGWGMARFDGPSVTVYTEPVRADKSEKLTRLIGETGKVGDMLAHIRRATVGGVKPENCHPFVRTDGSGHLWTLMHNGTVFSGLELIKYRSRQLGDTDSERILLYLVDKIDDAARRKGYRLNSYERFRVVEQVIRDLSGRNKLNLIVYDGEQMYVHVNMKDTLYYKTDNSGTVFATVPLDGDGWEPLPLATLFVYRSGRLLYRGECHHNEYVDPISTALRQLDYAI
jgi:glutamine amidotransferase